MDRKNNEQDEWDETIRKEERKEWKRGKAVAGSTTLNTLLGKAGLATMLKNEKCSPFEVKTEFWAYLYNNATDDKFVLP